MMEKIWKGAILPGEIPERLTDPECKKYIRFSDGEIFLCPSLTNPDSRSLAMALEEEHTDLGRALVAALWFDRPVQIILNTRQETLGLEMCVYRCHIAGPLFAQKLLEARNQNPNGDMASAWELRFLKNIEAGDVSKAKMPDRALEPELHLDVGSMDVSNTRAQ